MFCDNCGNEVENGSNFCPKCGAKFETKNQKHLQMKLQEN